MQFLEYNTLYSLPPGGLYCRHVDGLNMKNISCRLLRSEARWVHIIENIVDVDLPRTHWNKKRAVICPLTLTTILFA